jgi:LysM repeat protein
MAILGSNGSAVLISDQEKLDFESVPEYVREPRSSSRESYVSKSCYVEDEELSRTKSAEIETLWPGVSADFLHGAHNKKAPSFYWGVGFLSGIVTTIIGIGITVFCINFFANAGGRQEAPRIVLAEGTTTSTSAMRTNVTAARGGTAEVAVVTTKQSPASDAETIVPLFTSYTVRTGDTLAGIALQAYKRATPRLMDEICKANGMRNANVLSLGQTITLPEYHPQSSQVASGATLH